MTNTYCQKSIEYSRKEIALVIKFINTQEYLDCQQKENLTQSLL